jgi:predicted Zn-dependent peptidase
VDSVGVETQRGVVKEERRMRYDNQPYGKVNEEVFKRAFKVHPYRWMPIGSAQYIDQAKLTEFMDFYKTFYIPNNATLTIAGDIKIEQAKEWVKKYYGDIAKGTKEVPRPNVQEPPLGAEVIDSVFDKIQLPMISHTYRIISQTHADAYAVEMLMMVLGDGENSRLNKRLIDKENKAVQASAYARPMEDAGIANMTVVANLGVKPAEIDGILDSEVERIKNELISEDEYTALINKIENYQVSSKASMASIAENLAVNYVYYKGNTNLINTELDLYKKVTREDIKRVANLYLQKNNRVNLHVLPKK